MSSAPIHLPEGSTQLSEEFRRAHTEIQVASICRTHYDNPARTREFLAAVESGEIELQVSPDSHETRYALRTLGISPGLVTDRPPPPDGKYRSLSWQFMRATPKRQLETVYRERANRAKWLDFLLAVSDGAITLPASLSDRHRSLALKLGVPIYRITPPIS